MTQTSNSSNNSMPALLLFDNDFVAQSEIKPFLKSLYLLVSKKTSADRNKSFNSRKKKKMKTEKVRISIQTSRHKRKASLCSMENGGICPDENRNRIEDDPVFCNNDNRVNLIDGKQSKIGKLSIKTIKKKPFEKRKSINSSKHFEQMEIRKGEDVAVVNRNFDEQDINKTCRRRNVTKRTKKDAKRNHVEVDDGIFEVEPICYKMKKSSHKIGEDDTGANTIKTSRTDGEHDNGKESDKQEQRTSFLMKERHFSDNTGDNRTLQTCSETSECKNECHSHFVHNATNATLSGGSIFDNNDECYSATCSDVEYKLSVDQQYFNAIPDVPEYIALDCEFVGVGEKRSNALGRCSVVDYNGNVLYDVHVKPEKKITDYRTPWSGIRPSDMVRAIPLDIAQEELKKIIKGKVIVGHAVYNDFKVLGVRHPPEDVRDTSTCKELLDLARVNDRRCASLKTLSLALLGRSIQKSEHCSVEDARAAMDVFKLVQWNWEEKMEAKRSLRKKRRANDDDNELGTSFLSDKFWTSHLHI